VQIRGCNSDPRVRRATRPQPRRRGSRPEDRLRHARLVREMSGLLILRREVVADGGDSSTLERDARRGRLVRLTAGAYVRADEWAALTRAERHAARVHAVVPRLGPDTFVSHESALALQGFPLLGEWPTRVHVVSRGRPRTKVSSTVHRHAVALRDDETCVVQGAAGGAGATGSGRRRPPTGPP
jgi:hypothetical protein